MQARENCYWPKRNINLCQIGRDILLHSLAPPGEILRIAGFTDPIKESNVMNPDQVITPFP